jgi:Xaa-Pro dipeptidase
MSTMAAHAFARDYLMMYGTEITDLELQTATNLWLSDLLYQELDLAGGRLSSPDG